MQNTVITDTDDIAMAFFLVRSKHGDTSSLVTEGDDYDTCGEH